MGIPVGGYLDETLMGKLTECRWYHYAGVLNGLRKDKVS